MSDDKPASTVHGAGSGEAHRETQEQPRLCEHGYNWNTCSLCYRPTPPHLLTALQKVEADRNRYIQRAGNAEGRLEIMQAELQALRQENARLKVKSNALDRAHALLDRLDVLPAQGRVCDDPNCETHIEHRIHMLSDRAAALSPARESDHAGL